MTAAWLRKATVLCLAGVLSACSGDGKQNETADEFVARANGELLEIGKESARASWVQLTYITPDTEALAAKST
ncbi:MAG: M2 family metallopeptidase, partial [Pseudomonadota bacterium]|nr:M2 family metallopeptidase [Pseudomonadota bacterium]